MLKAQWATKGTHTTRQDDKGNQLFILDGSEDMVPYALANGLAIKPFLLSINGEDIGAYATLSDAKRAGSNIAGGWSRRHING